MKKAASVLSLVMLGTGMAAGQWPGRIDEQRIPPKDVKYIAVMAVQVVDPTRSYLMVCSESRPDCNTVYTTEYRYIPFATAEDALAYLNATANVLVRLLSVSSVPVQAKETASPIHHPDTQEKSTHYSPK